MRTSADPTKPKIAMEKSSFVFAVSPDGLFFSSFFFLICSCAIDTTLGFQTTDGPRIEFQVQAFKFLGSYPNVFVHCNVVVCHSSDIDSTCSAGCATPSGPHIVVPSAGDGRPELRRRRQALVAPNTTSIEATMKVSNGPFSLAKGEGKLTKFFFFEILSDLNQAVPNHLTDESQMR